jgi:hypothetical protein
LALAFDVAFDVAFDLQPLRQAERRCPSGGWARSAMRRSRIHREEVQRSKPEAMPPDGHRSEGTLSLSEVPYAGGSLFGYFFGVWKK